MAIFVSRNGEQYGPYTIGEIRKYVNEGMIELSDLARTPEVSTYIKVQTLLQRENCDLTLSSNGLSRPMDGASFDKKAGRQVITSDVNNNRNALTWPFHQEQWWTSIWMPCLWWIPVIGTVISSGWTVGVIRRRAARQSELPPPDDLNRVVKDGITVAVMSILFFVVPSLIFLTLAQFKLFELVMQLAKYGWIDLLFNPGKVLWMVAEKGAIEYLLEVGIISTVCTLAAWPFFVIGELRFALTGKILSFFNLFGNINLMFRHLRGLVSYLFLVLSLRLALYTLSIILTSALVVTVVLALVTFIAPPVIAHLISARLAGTLAREMHEQEHI